MNYITDYQLDIKKGFQCKVNGKIFNCSFAWSCHKKRYYVSHLLKLADAMEIPRQEFIGIFNSDYVNDVLYCNSEQQCYDLCQHIVNTYFKPAEIGKDIINFRCGNESYKFELKLLAGKYVWENTIDKLKYIVNKSQINLTKLREELKIKIYELANFGYLGFDSKEDALKFAKWVKENFYNKKEWCEKSRRHLLKYYNLTGNVVCLSGNNFVLYKWNNEGHWFWRNTSVGAPILYEQFKLTKGQVLVICNNLNLLAYFNSNVLIFENATDAIKFTDYLIETYIIKKEKTYDTNQLRKERTSISRGTKPAGGIIHGRRSKASVRCGCIEHKACLGN